MTLLKCPKQSFKILKQTKFVSYLSVHSVYPPQLSQFVVIKTAPGGTGSSIGDNERLILVNKL